jgi:hypothetical protein
MVHTIRADRVQQSMSGQGMVTSTSPETSTPEKTLRTSCGRTPQPRLCLAYVISLILSDSRNTNDPSTCPEYQGASLYIVPPLAHSRKSQSGKDSIEISVRQFALILSRQKRSASRTLDDLCDVLLYTFRDITVL